MAEQLSEYMPEHIPGLKLVHLSHMSDRKHVRTHTNKDVRTQSRTFPNLCQSTNPICQSKRQNIMPIAVLGITRSKVVLLVLVESRKLTIVKILNLVRLNYF